MSEHPGLEFAPQSLRPQILPSMSPLVLFIISIYTFLKEKVKGSDRDVSTVVLRVFLFQIAWFRAILK